MRVVGFLLVAAGLPACKVELLLTPELPDDIGSAIVLVVASQGTHAYARDPAAASIIVSEDQSEMRVIVSGQRKTLSELGLEPGELGLADAGGSVLPHADVLLSASVLGSSASAFETLQALPPPLDKLRLALPPQRACLEAGGCLDAPDAAGFAACHASCGAITPPSPASPPEPPLFLPCPNGWSEVERDGLITCEPFPNGRPACALGSFQPPGNSTCIPLGPDCARFARDLPAGATIVYVDPSAGPGGDGSQALPFDTLAAGLLAAAPGTIVALAAGELDQPIQLADGDILWGACPAQTRLRIGPNQVGVTLRAGQAEIHGLSISGGRHAISAQNPGSLLTLQNVWVETSSLGIAVSGAELRADGLALDRAALSFDAGARGELRHFSSVRSPQTGLRVTNARVLASDLVVDRSNGAAISLIAGAGLELSRAALFTQGYRAIAMYTASTATVSDLVVRADLRPTAIYSLESRLSATRVSVTGGAAPFILGGNSVVSFSDVVLADSGSELVMPAGRSALAGAGQVRLSRALIARSRTEALRAIGLECELELEDVRMIGTSSTSLEPNRGRGLLVNNGAHVTLRRVTVESVRTLGVEVADGGRLEGTDLRVLNILPTDELEGRGLRVTGPSTVELDRVEVRGAYTAALISYDDGRMTLRDVTIADVQAGDCGCIYAEGDGFSAGVNGEIHVTRFQVRRVASAGVRIDASAQLLLREGSILDSPVGIYALIEPDAFAGLLQQVSFSNIDTLVLP